MFEFPTVAMFTAFMSDARFPAALAIAALSGLVRGFTGFGAALTYIPLMSAVYGPQVAVPSFVIADTVTGFAFVASAWRKAQWGEVLPMALAAIVAGQFGTLILQYADPVFLRWVLSLFIGGAVALLAAGWRYHGKPSLLLTVAVGTLSGLLGGALQITGPPIIVYWLGGMMTPDIVRANFFGFFSLFSTASVVTYAAHGLMTTLVLTLAAFVTPVSMLGMAAGSYLFGYASERVYRRIGYTVVALAALVSLPLFDGLLR